MIAGTIVKLFENCLIALVGRWFVRSSGAEWKVAFASMSRSSLPTGERRLRVASYLY
jgi:hypothetical protein